MQSEVLLFKSWIQQRIALHRVDNAFKHTIPILPSKQHNEVCSHAI